MLRNILILVFIAFPLLLAADSTADVAGPEADPAVESLIEKIGLWESDVASRDLEGWSPPKKIVVSAPRFSRSPSRPISRQTAST